MGTGARAGAANNADKGEEEDGDEPASLVPVPEPRTIERSRRGEPLCEACGEKLV